MTCHPPAFLRIFFLGLAILTTVLVAGEIQAAEVILGFNSDITVHVDSSMIVTETIKVRAEGRQIRRGIYRDFPTTYRDRFGNRIRVDMDLVSVKRDGKPESHHIENLRNGLRIYVGHRDVFLKPGIYTYAITYRTNRQLGYFDEHDELYWNLTGNGWAFPIERASAAVTIPNSVPAAEIRTEGYTGPHGSREQSYTSRIDYSGRIVFEAKRQLGPEEGFTIVIGWPKGHVTEPGKGQRIIWLLTENRGLMVSTTGLLILLIYYFLAWRSVGRDPERGTIIPLFEPPDNLSPAAMRYIMEMGFDNRAFASAVINLAVKGCITIDEEDKAFGLVTTYILRRTGKEPGKPLSRGEQKLLKKLFPGNRKSLKLEKTNHKKISGAVNALKELLKKEYSKSTFINNRGYMVAGVLISVIVLLLSGLTGQSRSGGPPLLFVILWLVPWTFGTLSLWATRRFFMAAVFTFFLIGATIAFAAATSVIFIASLLLIAAVNILFYTLLKAPTNLGRRIMDKLEGFRMYLSTAEEHRLEKLHPPERTPELFERYLPYALALEVDQQWSEKFSDVLERAAQEGTYSPGWYHGHHWSPSQTGMFASGLGSSLSSAISSSSTAPGSSSGFGGGGSSGGGGGGGGGGGW
jgi:uncharacterized membrane protein YgcG